MKTSYRKENKKGKKRGDVEPKRLRPLQSEMSQRRNRQTERAGKKLSVVKKRAGEGGRGGQKRLLDPTTKRKEKRTRKKRVNRKKKVAAVGERTPPGRSLIVGQDRGRRGKKKGDQSSEIAC